MNFKLERNFVLRPAEAIRGASAPHMTPERFEIFSKSLKSLGPSGQLAGLSGVTVRINDVYIRNNHADVIGIDISTDVYLVAMVVSQKGTSVEAIRPFGVFNGIYDDMQLPITHAWAIDRQLDGVPEFLDVHVVVMRSMQGQRELATEILAAMKTDEYAAAQTALTTAVTSANPVAGTVLSVAEGLFQVVMGIVAKQKDRQIFYGVASFEDSPDDLGIGRRWHLGRRAGPSVSRPDDAVVTFEVVGRKH